MRYSSKQALLSDIVEQHGALSSLIDSVPADRRSEAAVWGDGWSIRDLVAHLSAWHEMFLRWYGEGAQGARPELPAPGYGWNQTPELNRAIWKKHKDRVWEDVWADFERGYEEILGIAEGLTEEELLEPGAYAWTGKNPLRTYLGANTASHYRFGIKVIKRWMREARA